MGGIAAAGLLAPSAAAEPLYQMTREQKVRYLANLMDLGMQVTPDNADRLIASGYNVCYPLVRDDRPGSFPFEFTTDIGYSRHDASAITVDAMCPAARFKLQNF